MKKLSYFLLILIILAQLGWLSVQYDTLSQELETAPHMLVQGQLSRSSLKAATVEKIADPDDSFFGGSVWWDQDTFSPIYIASTQFSNKELREQMKKNLPTRPKNTQDFPQSEKLNTADYVVGFWAKGEGDLWQLKRIAAENSSEDSPQEGELRTYMRVHSKVTSHPDNKEELQLIWRFDLLPSKSSRETLRLDPPILNFDYDLPPEQKQLKDEKITLDIVLREKRSAIIRQAYIDGKPLDSYIQERKSELEKAGLHKSNSVYGIYTEIEEIDSVEVIPEPQPEAESTPAAAEQPTEVAPAQTEQQPEAEPTPAVEQPTEGAPTQTEQQPEAESTPAAAEQTTEVAPAQTEQQPEAESTPAAEQTTEVAPAQTEPQPEAESTPATEQPTEEAPTQTEQQPEAESTPATEQPTEEAPAAA